MQFVSFTIPNTLPISSASLSAISPFPYSRASSNQTTNMNSLPPDPTSSQPSRASTTRLPITIPPFANQQFAFRNGQIDPQASPHSAQSPFHTSTPLTSPFNQDHGSVPYSPQLQQFGNLPQSFISPSIPLASLSILTPQRPLPASLPPTPQIASSQPSPKDDAPPTRPNPFATSNNNSSSSLNGSSLRTSYTKMLRRQSASGRKTNMPPPLPPLMTKGSSSSSSSSRHHHQASQPQGDLWNGLNEFISHYEPGGSYCRGRATARPFLTRQMTHVTFFHRAFARHTPSLLCLHRSRRKQQSL